MAGATPLLLGEGEERTVDQVAARASTSGEVLSCGKNEDLKEEVGPSTRGKLRVGVEKSVKGSEGRPHKKKEAIGSIFKEVSWVHRKHVYQGWEEKEKRGPN